MRSGTVAVFAILVAALAGLLVPALDVATVALRGALTVPDARGLLRVALTSAAAAAAEGSLVLLCFAALGRFRGLRPTGPTTEA